MRRDAHVPIGDDNSQERTVSVVTYALIALNVLFFLVELSGGDQVIDDWAFFPARFSAHPGKSDSCPSLQVVLKLCGCVSCTRLVFVAPRRS